jgi:dihydroorotate dehydrogenase (fumarate)
VNSPVLAPLRPDPAGRSRIRARVASALLGAALALGAALPLAGPAAAATDPTVGIAAAPAKQGQPDGRARFSLSVAAGQASDDQLLVRNSGTTDQTFDVYATDAFDTDDGAFALLDQATAPSGAGTWVTFRGGSRTTTLELAAGAQALVPFTVTAPARATPGDHAAGIVVSSSSGTVDRRLATRLYVRVQGTVTPALVVRSVHVSQPLGGNPFAAPATITAVVANVGDVALSAHADASVRSWFGLAQGTVASDDVAELLPGATRTLTFRVGSVGRVGYIAPHVTLRPAADSDAYAFALPPVEGRGAAAAVPWLALAAVAVIAAGVLLVLRRRRAAPPPELPGAVRTEPVRTATER